ncbi:endolytic transglycosylase MltG [Vibrio vulnificus]|uniref:endolytic transglycosylase MltG n=1 Tax=Vibrio vulnificus TaxID=672 RepID=UPI001CDD8826|nr:endolytic transglycosylase MltG [Vibrio vulnificus]MCA3915476.1 endolytic transglycosylase MltG [Vibrio vulnificus]MCG6313919.1 endolytic transglycosylase MltG [Vibrio vulnificus]
MIKKIIGLLFIAALMIGVAAVWAYSQTKTYFNQPLKIESSEIITIPSGSGFGRTLAILTEKGWIDEPTPLARLIPKLYPEITRIKAGTYQIQSEMSLYQALEVFNLGKEHQFTITFVEGSRFQEWMVQMAQDPYLIHELAGLSEAEIAKRLEIPYEKLEGLFLAETYHYTYGTSDVELLKRAHEKLNRVLDKHWQQRQEKLPLDNSYEALILASIIEKETAIDEERERVASVFVNRLNKRMRLQTDPTVIYGMGEAYDGNIRKKDLRTPTPYNTYVINGLPPTPIAMAGEASIAAALNPENSSYLYFVASGKGGHVFSKTLAEHNRAVRAYLRELKKR